MSYNLMPLPLEPTSVFGVDRTSGEIGIMAKRRREPMDHSRGTPMDAGDLPGSPIRGDSVMGNERASERLRVRIPKRGARDRDRENEKSPPTPLSKRRSCVSAKLA